MGLKEASQRPVGLAPNGTYTRSHRVRVDGGIVYLPAGVGTATLEATRHEVEILPDIRRRRDRRRDDWGVGASLPTGDLD